MQRMPPHLQRHVQRNHAKPAPTTEEVIHRKDDLSEANPSSRQLLQLQGIIGNQAVQRLIAQPPAAASASPSADVQRVEEGEDYVHSAHSEQRMEERNISVTQLERTLDDPDFVNNLGGGRSEYLSQLPSGLIMRVIVSNETPMTIITMMKVRKHKSYR